MGNQSEEGGAVNLGFVIILLACYAMSFPSQIFTDSPGYIFSRLL